MRYLTKHNINLFIAGNGDLECSLRKQSANLKNTFFVGRKSDPYSFISSLDLLVVPSIREPLGNVCLEAGLCNVPVLASNVDGIPEIIENKVSGELICPTDDLIIDTSNSHVPIPEFVVDPCKKKLSIPKQINSKTLAKKILKLSNSPKLLEKYGDNLNEKIVKHFSIENYTDKLHSIYSKI
jgi:glycosyltransferase involved in cell wall biosynthesis